jgi:hypothetical protein
VTLDADHPEYAPGHQHYTRRPHALFPRPPGSGPEDRDIRWIGIRRKLPPKAGKGCNDFEHCPHDFPADELPDWAAVHKRFGGGAYKVCAKDSQHRILCWSSEGHKGWYVMDGRSKPLCEEEDDDDEVRHVPLPAPAVPAPAAAPVPVAEPPSMDTVAFLLQVIGTQQRSMELQAQSWQHSMERQAVVSHAFP